MIGACLPPFSRCRKAGGEVEGQRWHHAFPMTTQHSSVMRFEGRGSSVMCTEVASAMRTDVASVMRTDVHALEDEGMHGVSGARSTDA